MSFSNILILAGIISAFVLFGIVLAWGEYQTRHLKRPGAEAESAARVQELKEAA